MIQTIVACINHDRFQILRKHIHKTASTLVGERFKCVVNGKLSEAAKLNLFLWLVAWNIFHFSSFFHILGIIISTDFHIFQWGRSTSQPPTSSCRVSGSHEPEVFHHGSLQGSPCLWWEILRHLEMSSTFGASDGNLYRKDRKGKSTKSTWDT